ncbi:MAG: SurA N-terminal domain-containing protein [Gammaproteobacteria bacterium]
MLQNIRNVVTGWFAVVIVTVMIVPFALFGINYYFDGSANLIAAKVGDREITVTEYQREFFNFRRELQNRMGNTSIDSETEELIKQQALQRIIENQLLVQKAHDLGMRIGDEAVIKTIAGLEPFQRDGRFSQALYQQALAQSGFTVDMFERQIRQEMLTEQMQTALLTSTFITDTEVQAMARLDAQTRDVLHATIDARAVYDSIEVNDADIEKYYNENQRSFQEPQQIRIAYLDLSLDTLSPRVEVTEDRLQAYFETNRANYNQPETRKIEQIIVRLMPDADAEALDQVRTQASFLRDKIEAGESFADVVENYRDEFEQVPELLNLNAVKQGELSPEVDAEVFALEEGELSQPIQSDVGLHVIRLEEVQLPRDAEFDEVREKLEEDYREAEAEKLFFEEIERLSNAAFEHPDSLEVAAAETGLEVQISDWFNEGGGSGVAANPDVVLEAFSDEVLKEGLNSQPVDLSDTRVVVLRVAEHKPARTLALDEVREEIINDIKFTRAQEQARERGEAILEALRQGTDPEQVAAEYDIEWQFEESVARNDTNVSRSVLRAAFRAGQPETAGTIYAGVSIGSGDYIIVGVSNVQTPEVDSLSDDERQQLRQQLIQARAQNTWISTLEDMRARADIRIFDSNLNL